MLGIEKQFWPELQLGGSIIKELDSMKKLLENEKPREYKDAISWCITSDGRFMCRDKMISSRIFGLYINEEENEIYVKVSDCFSGYEWFRLLIKNSVESAVNLYSSLVKSGKFCVSFDILVDLKGK